MEKVNRKTTKLCSFYVSDWHLVTMILPYLNEEINKENKIVTLLEKNIKEKVETLVKKLNLKNSKQILNINWNIIKTKKYLELKNILNNEGKVEKNITIMVNGTKKFIDNIGNVIVLGSGDGTKNNNFANGLDIMGHEFMHGYIKNTDKNIFDDQGFAIGEVDETFCDVMGNIIENYCQEKIEVKSVSYNENLTFENDKSWLLGEDVVREPNKRVQKYVKSKCKWKSK